MFSLYLFTNSSRGYWQDWICHLPNILRECMIQYFSKGILWLLSYIQNTLQAHVLSLVAECHFGAMILEILPHGWRIHHRLIGMGWLGMTVCSHVLCLGYPNYRDEIFCCFCYPGTWDLNNFNSAMSSSKSRSFKTLAGYRLEGAEGVLNSRNKICCAFLHEEIY